MALDVGRRGFFSLFGGALASAPAVGREVAARLAGAGGGSLFTGTATARAITGRLLGDDKPEGYDGEDDPAPEDEGPFSPRAERMFKNAYRESHETAVRHMLRKHGPSPYALSRAWNDAQDAAFQLPPHIACLRSFSPEAKRRLAVDHYFKAFVTRDVQALLSEANNREYEDQQEGIRTRVQRSLHEKAKAFMASLLKTADRDPVGLSSGDDKKSEYTRLASRYGQTEASAGPSGGGRHFRNRLRSSQR